MKKTFLEWLKTDKHIIKDFWLNPKSLAVSECNGEPFIVKCDSNISDENIKKIESGVKRKN